MKCPECQFDNREGAKFCSECGNRFEITCPECNTKIRLGSKFCDECGYDLKKPQDATAIDYSKPQSYTPKFLADKILSSRSSIAGERKLVTVFFADVANYTSIAEKLDPEEVHQIMDRLFKILMDEIHKYEGTINQFTGDGIMAIFGAPVSHEDHAQRACYAALAVQRAMADFSEKLKDEKGIDFKIRIGLNTGPVVVGSIGDDLRMDYTALGDTTNLAARMQQGAESGSILMSDSSYKIIRPHFVTEPLGELQVKGKKEPVITYRLKRTRRIRSLMDIVAEKALSPLRGRSEEFNRFHRLWDLCKKGNGQVVFIVGEAGIGKSRLVFELHRALSAEKITWLEGRCTAYGRNMPFLPLIDLLKRNFRIDEEDSEQIIIRKIDKGLSVLGEETKERAPFLKFLFSVDPGDALIHSMDAQGRRRMVFDSIRLMTIRGSKRRPLILFFEDLHWIDHESEDFLKYVINSLAVLPVMLILTYRPGYANPFGERTFFNHISLKALQNEDSLDLTKDVIGVDRLPKFIEPLILERAEGNPLYIEEIAKSLEELGIFKKIEANGTVKAQDQIQIPTSIQDIIMARIDRLPEEQKVALQLAAVIGREFANRLLERIAKLQAGITDILDDLVRLEILYQTQFYPELSFMFKHALTHDVAYNSLLTSKRKAIHALTGKVIEEIYSTRLGEHYEILAHHYEQGEVWDKAIAYLILSGQKALGNMAIPSAHTFFEKVIDISSQEDVALSPEQAYESYQGKGNTEFNMGYFDVAEKDFFKAREIAKDIGDKNKEAESLSMAGWSMASGKKYEEVINIYHEAADFGRQIGNPIIEGRNYSGLGLIKLALGEVETAGKFMEKAVQIAQKINSPLLLILSLSLRAFQFPHYGIPDEEAVEYLDKSIPVLKSVQNARACVLVYLILGYYLACKGDYTASIATFQEGINFAEETGEALNRAKGLNWLGWVYGELGWISEAKKLNRESYKASLEMGSGSEEVEANAAVNLAENAVAEKDYGQAENYIADLLKKAETDPGYLFIRHRWEVRQLCTSAEIFLYKGDTDEAMQCAQRAFEIAKKTKNKRGMIRANRHMGKIYIKNMEFSKAEKKLNGAITDAKKLGNPYQLWKTHLDLGKLKEAQDFNQDAQKQYRQALEIIENIGSNLKGEKTRKIFLDSDLIIEIKNKVK
ncbi:MAG: adenylate/guanylate cyclase domain-containing protein [Desulfobacterales bacterium]|jgi:class 3 adenylate cyclase/tetratricopeptide (TPR) repeat protein